MVSGVICFKRYVKVMGRRSVGMLFEMTDKGESQSSCGGGESQKG